VGFNFEDVLLVHLVRGCEERFELDAMLAPIVRRWLERDDAFEAVRAILKLAVALERDLESPSAARELKRILASEPTAVDLIRDRLLDRRPIDETRRFLRSEGREDAIRAPSEAEDAPEGAFPLSRWIDRAGGIRWPRIVRSRMES
jgi:hypothetical protein